MDDHRFPFSIPGRGRRCARLLLFLLPAVGLAGDQPTAGHPMLVDVQATTCTGCHGDLLDGRATVHAPAAEECTACHEVSISDSETRISLTLQEPSLCLSCHEDLAGAVGGDLDVAHMPVTESCLICHDPHATDGRSLMTIPQAELCTTCHEAAELAEPHRGQLTSVTACTNCHQPHGSGNEHMLAGTRLHTPFEDGDCEACHRAPLGERTRLRARGSRLCRACHSDGMATTDGGGSVHAALRDRRGQNGCLACHAPHMASNAGLLLRPRSELCRECHREIVDAAKSVSGHPPAAEDCLNCHQPHASGEAHLLDAPAEELCATCHDVEDADLARVHLDADLATLDCMSCHTPHGGDNSGLLAGQLHAPLLDGCDTCHEGAADRLMEDGESSLCLICHDDIGEAAEKAQFPHPALDVTRCADCHNPHASAQEHLVRLPGGSVCVDCHEDQAPSDDQVAHGIIELIGCRACHEPHGGDREHMLRETGSELCLSCHDPARVVRVPGESTVLLLDRFRIPAGRGLAAASLRLSPDGERGHPVHNHRVLGTPTDAELKAVDTTFQGELTCLTCHDPHKGSPKGLLRWNSASTLEACLQCHPK